MFSIIKTRIFSIGVPFELCNKSFTMSFNMYEEGARNITEIDDNVSGSLFKILPTALNITANKKKGDHKKNLIRKVVISYCFEGFN
jgi:hypothetical protein